MTFAAVALFFKSRRIRKEAYTRARRIRTISRKAYEKELGDRSEYEDVATLRGDNFANGEVGRRLDRRHPREFKPVVDIPQY